ncbi:MAG: hypothetical protein AABY69_00200 [Nitrospirota bacterium]
MTMVKLRFKNEADDAAGALALAKHFKVICLPGDVYEVPDQALTLLDTLHLPYTLLETEGFDHAIRTLRNPTASQV